MQITIKDTIIKRMLAMEVEDCLSKRNSKLVKEIWEDPVFQKRLARELSAFFNEQADVIGDMIAEVRIPQLSKAIRESF